MMEWHVLPKERCQSLVTVVLCVLLLCGGPLLALDGNTASGTARHEVIPLQQITPERGRDFLARLQIGTVSRMPGVNSLLVTGRRDELQKAVAVLELVDTRTEFDVRSSGPPRRRLPSNTEIAHAVGGVCIGTFANPPKDKTRMRAIVDVHDGHVVVIAPASSCRTSALPLNWARKFCNGANAPVSRRPCDRRPTIQAAAMLESSAECAGR